MIYKKIFMLAFGALFFSQVPGQGLWTQKANIPCSGRCDLASFSIEQKGYFGCGTDTNGKMNNDLWEWNQVTNSWLSKVSLPGLPRRSPISFSIEKKGYICVGIDSTNNGTPEVWEWDQNSNTWSQKSDFPGPCRGLAVGFSIGSKGYIGTGSGEIGYLKDFWEYDQATDTWTQKADFGGSARYDAQGFSIGNKGYIGGGISDIGPPFLQIDFWEYDPLTDTWTQKANLPEYRCNAAGFSIGNNGYFCAGVNDVSQLNDLIEWNQSINIWTHKAALPANARHIPIGFSIGNKGYVGMGVSAQSLLNDFWEYTPEGNVVYEFEPESNVLVYPNPFSDFTMLQFTTSVHNATLSVYDILGNEIKRIENFSGKGIKISRSGMSSGMYFFKVFDHNITIGQGKIIVE